MVEDHLSIIESRVQSSSNLPEAAKVELLEVIGELRAELRGVNKEHLAGEAAASHGESIDEVVGGLTGTLATLEATHPRLVQLANRLAVALSNVGI